MCGPPATPDATEAFPRYLFIVARNRPDILKRVQERLQGDPRVEVLADRRFGERRKSTVPPASDRRRADRRRPTKFWDDLTVHPTLVAPKRIESYAELEREAATASRESKELRAENGGLRDEIATLQRRIETLSSANEELCEENSSLRAQIASVQTRIDALASANEELRAAAGRLCVEIASLQSWFAALAQRLTADPKVTGRRLP